MPEAGDLPTADTDQATRVAVQMRGVVKRFGSTIAIDGASFELRYGEVHALLGENGAGKSSLMNVLAGLYRPDQGTVLLDGVPAPLHSPEDARRLGIGMVHQELRLVGRFTAPENVALGHQQPRWLTLPGYFRRLAACLTRRYGLPIDDQVPTWLLPLGRRQRVELVKLLYHGARIIILDEPTANLAPAEVETFFGALRQLTGDRKHGVVFITHKLDEVGRYTDRVTVMRHGRVVATRFTHQTSRATLNQLMVGDDVVPANVEDSPAVAALARSRVEVSAREPVLQVDRLTVRANGSEARDISLTVHAGEVLAVAGVAGNGQGLFAEAVTGHMPSFDGTIQIGGQDIRGLGARAVYDLGVAYIPEDRREVGLIPSQSVAMNLALRHFDRRPFSRGGWVDQARLRQDALAKIARYGIRPANPDLLAGKLSGGNQQRVIIAREFSSNPRLIVADNFTRGLDPFSAERLTRELFAAVRERGAAAIWITGDLAEALLCDRVAVFFRGRLNGLLDRAGLTRERVGLLMSSAEHAEVDG